MNRILNESDYNAEVLLFFEKSVNCVDKLNENNQKKPLKYIEEYKSYINNPLSIEYKNDYNLIKKEFLKNENDRLSRAKLFYIFGLIIILIFIIIAITIYFSILYNEKVFQIAFAIGSIFCLLTGLTINRMKKYNAKIESFNLLQYKEKITVLNKRYANIGLTIVDDQSLVDNYISDISRLCPFACIQYLNARENELGIVAQKRYNCVLGGIPCNAIVNDNGDFFYLLCDYEKFSKCEKVHMLLSSKK